MFRNNMFDLKHRSGNFAVIIISILLVLGATKYVPAEWAWKHPYPTAATFNDIICNNGICVAVGEYGTIAVSSDGQSWSLHPIPLKLNIFAVTFGNGRFVAVGELGLIISSSNGTDWTVQNPLSEYDLKDVIFSEGKFVAAGHRNILVSDDGQTWTTCSQPVGEFHCVAARPGQYIIGGASGLIYTSPDAVNWTKQTYVYRPPYGGYEGADAFSVTKIKWCDTMWVAAITAPSEDVLVSKDGSTWTNVMKVYTSTMEKFYYFRDIIKTDSLFIITGTNGYVLTSPDAQLWNWTEHKTNLGIENLDLNAIISYGDELLAAGTYGLTATSADGMTWLKNTGTLLSMYPNLNSGLNSIVHGANKFVSVGDSTILTSLDGNTWIERQHTFSGTFNSISWNGSQFLIVTPIDTVLSSTDGISWTSHQTPGANGIRFAIWGNSRYIGFGGNSVYSSTDGISWTSAPLPDDELINDALWTGSKFIAVGQRGTYSGWEGALITSPDGETWEASTSNGIANSPWNSIAQTNAGLIAVGQFGWVAKSADGVVWGSERAHDYKGEYIPDDLSIPTFQRVTTTSKYIVALNHRGGIAFSEDGNYWQYQQFGSSSDKYPLIFTGFFDICSYHDSLFAVGAHASILFSEIDAPSIGKAPLISPAHASRVAPPAQVCSWNSATNAVRYSLQISDDSLFSSLTDQVEEVSSTSISLVEYNIELDTGKTYYWRVKSINATGGHAFSDVWKFTAAPPPPESPVLITPNNGAAEQPLNIQLSWYPLYTATSYRVQVSADSLFSILFSDDSSLISETFAAGQLSAGTTYYWRVLAKGNGGAGPWSETRSFSTIPQKPESATLYFPSNSAIIRTDTVRLIWSKANPLVGTYRLQVATDSLFQNCFLTDSTITDTATTLRLYMNATIYWRVQARNISGWGDFSDTGKFIVDMLSTAVLPKQYSFKLTRALYNSSSITYALPKASDVSLRIYNAQGKVIVARYHSNQEAGYYKEPFDISRLSGGFYVLDFKASSFAVKRVLHKFR